MMRGRELMHQRFGVRNVLGMFRETRKDLCNWREEIKMVIRRLGYRNRKELC